MWNGLSLKALAVDDFGLSNQNVTCGKALAVDDFGLSNQIVTCGMVCPYAFAMVTE